ncbi:ribonuclease domain-containing protein [Candidatus Pantoea formicae]|uniref:ribonuclease domain-containing protein n=1 Tax=Candidatus Pantoea formicae TaxID=2608355 RepID=UPI003EDA71FD
MSKKLWIGLIFALAATWAGLKPHLNGKSAAHDSNIAQLTEANTVARWLEQHHRLPDLYLTKSEARRQGWNPSKGDLCNVLPGRAIGGDRFSNREQRLPMQQGRQWYEADVNYDCGHRDADRLLYSSDGLIFLTTDHYRSFKQVN